MLLPLLLAQATPLAQFEQTLAATPSATAALATWCAARHLADPAQITAAQVTGEDALPAPDLDDTLKLAPEETPAYRHVRLSCGAKTLSEAHNWYAASRLTPEMNQQLATTNIPFGKVVATLNFRRETLAASPHAAGCPKDTILAHRALLRLPDGAPLALLIECYLPANLPR